MEKPPLALMLALPSPYCSREASLFPLSSFSFSIFGFAGHLVLGRRSSGCGEWGLLASWGHSLPAGWCLLLWSAGSRHTGFRTCVSQAQLLPSMWDLPGSGLEPKPLDHCLLSCGINAYSSANQPLNSRVIIVCKPLDQRLSDT